jgi:hypothetical protein
MGEVSETEGRVTVAAWVLDKDENLWVLVRGGYLLVYVKNKGITVPNNVAGQVIIPLDEDTHAKIPYVQIAEDFGILLEGPLVDLV